MTRSNVALRLLALCLALPACSTTSVAPAPRMALHPGGPPAASPPAAPVDSQPEKLEMTPVAPAGILWVRHPDHPFSILSTEVTVAQFRTCVDAGTCGKDTFTTCNYGVSGKDNHPMNCVDYNGAEQFCGFVGGRLCTEHEWLDACSGTDGRPFPYGTSFDLEACNSQSSTVTVSGRAVDTVPVGSMPKCKGGLPDVYDMAGNVTEWVDKCQGTYCKFRGGGYSSNDPIEMFAACKGVCSGNQKDFSSSTIGFRCCRTD